MMIQCDKCNKIMEEQYNVKLEKREYLVMQTAYLCILCAKKLSVYELVAEILIPISEKKEGNK